MKNRWKEMKLITGYGESYSNFIKYFLWSSKLWANSTFLLILLSTFLWLPRIFGSFLQNLHQSGCMPFLIQWSLNLWAWNLGQLVSKREDKLFRLFLDKALGNVLSTVSFFDSIYVSGKLPTYPSPNLTCPKWEASVNVGLGEGYTIMLRFISIKSRTSSRAVTDPGEGAGGSAPSYS